MGFSKMLTEWLIWGISCLGDVDGVEFGDLDGVIDGLGGIDCLRGIDKGRGTRETDDSSVLSYFWRSLSSESVSYATLIVLDKASEATCCSSER